MILTAENYHSYEANKYYMSVSQYKSFMGSLGIQPCEAKAYAELNGKWEEKTTLPMLVGSYVDAYFEGTLEKFKIEHPEIIVSRGTRKGELKADYVKADEIIRRVERDAKFMQYMSGEKQTIMTAELFGMPWKIKLDSYHKDLCIVDLKVMRSIRDGHWVKDYGSHVDFIQYWGYDIQGAIYQEVVYQCTGKRLPFYIAAVTKEEYPDIEIINIDNQTLERVLSEVKENMYKLKGLKSGEFEPIRCESCNYCRHTKVIESPIHFSELIGRI